MDWLNLVPLPIALGMVLYVNNKIEKHIETCPISKQMEGLNKKLDLILKYLLEHKNV